MPHLPIPHHCHAEGCTVEVKPELLMCLRHWRMVPRPLQMQVWAFYRKGQCDDKAPSFRWCDAADAAVRAVAEQEGKRVRLTFTKAFYPEGKPHADSR
jgi:hypothetical protein